METTVKVSICCITYNHEKFIAATLDGFLKQETGFDYEVVIGEDGSTDNTRSIINAYKQAFGDRLRVLDHGGNIGMIPNFIATVKACRGQYIAFCEGDDYWTDPLKLAKQVSFLDEHPDYCLVCHNCLNLLPGGKLESMHQLPEQDQSFDIESMNNNWFIPTLSVMLRNAPDLYFPDWLHQAGMGDLPFLLLYARSGRIHYFSETMAVYRIHAGGSWSSKNVIARAAASLYVWESLMNESFSEKQLIYLDKRRKLSQAEAFAYILYNGSATEYKAFLNDERFGYTHYQQHSRNAVRFKYRTIFIKNLGLLSRLKRLVKRFGGSYISINRSGK